MRNSIFAGKRSLLFLIAVILFIAPFFISNEYYYHVLVFIFLNIILAVSWNLIFQTGQVSLAHVAFMAIGAYTSTILVKTYSLPFLLGFVMAGILASVIACVIGIIVLRLKGIYFVMITFTLTEIVRLTITNNTGLLGGASGISAIPSPDLFGYQIDNEVKFYYVFLIIAMFTTIIVYRLLNTRIGRVLKSIQNNETLSQSVGVNIKYYKVFAFAAGAFFAGIAGSLYAHYSTHISPASFTFLRSFDILIFNIIGGTSALLGPILGSSIFTLLPEFLRSYADYQVLIYSLALIVSILFLKDGFLTIFAGIEKYVLKNSNRKQSHTSQEVKSVEDHV